MLMYGAAIGDLGVTCFILALSTTVASTAHLLCSQCSSRPRGDCVTSPPAPTACERTLGLSQGVNCMTARQLDRNGTLVRYIRGCTMVRVGKGCVQHHDNTTLCYETCHVDNCNLATGVHITMVTILFLVICSSVLFI